MEPAFEATTNGITVRVSVAYLDEHSDPCTGPFLWAYYITLINGGTKTVQLLRRSWQITDSTGRTLCVEGEGVVGEQPVLRPGMQFSYSSNTQLGTPSGFMVGTYHMQTLPEATLFDIAVPAFSLDSPYQDTQLH